MSLQAWRLFAIISSAVCACLCVAVIWVAFAFKANLAVIQQSPPICFANSADFDSIAAAQMIGRLDLVSFLLTAGGILLGVFALFAFFTIRREAIDQARDEARSVAITEASRIKQMFEVDKNVNGTYISTNGFVASDARGASDPSAAPTYDPNEVSTAGATLKESDDDGYEASSGRDRPPSRGRASNSDDTAGKRAWYKRLFRS